MTSPNSIRTNQGASSLPWKLALTVLLVGLVVSGVAAWWLARWSATDDARRLEASAQQVKQRFDTITEHYEFGLSRLADFFSGRSNVTETAWQSRLTLLNVRRNFPAVIELGYAPFVHAGNEEEYAASFARAHPGLSVPPLRRSDHWLPLLFHYRRDDSAPPAYGHDFHQHDNEHWFVVKQTVATAEVRTTQLSEQVATTVGSSKAGVRWFWPVYLPETEIMSAERSDEVNRLVRENGFQGVIFATVDFDRLLTSEFGEAAGELAVQIFDGPDPVTAQRVNRTVLVPPPGIGGQPADQTINVPWYGQQWRMVFHRLPLFDDRSTRDRAWWVLGAGVLTSVALAGFVWSQARSRQQALADAKVLRTANERLAASIEDRQRLQRNLHDAVLQRLYGATLHARRTQQSAGRGEPVSADELEQHVSELDAVMNELRGFLSGSARADLGGAELGSALRGLGLAFARQSGMAVNVEATSDALAIVPTECGEHLLQMAREGLSNAWRHGGAKSAVVRLDQHQGQLVVEVTDDGRGFDPQAPPNGGHGLANLAERAAQCGGAFEVISQPAGPTTLRATIPARTSS